MKKRLDWLSRELLTSPYCYALCLNERDFKAELKWLKIPKKLQPDFLRTEDCGATANFFAQRGNKGKCVIVTLRKQKGLKLEQIYAILVHEAVHIWQAIRETIGETSPASEQEAYAIQRIAQSLMFSYKEQTAKKGKRK